MTHDVQFLMAFYRNHDLTSKQPFLNPSKRLLFAFGKSECLFSVSSHQYPRSAPAGSPCWTQSAIHMQMHNTGLLFFAEVYLKWILRVFVAGMTLTSEHIFICFFRKPSGPCLPRKCFVYRRSAMCPSGNLSN